MAAAVNLDLGLGLAVRLPTSVPRRWDRTHFA